MPVYIPSTIVYTFMLTMYILDIQVFQLTHKNHELGFETDEQIQYGNIIIAKWSEGLFICILTGNML